MPALIDSLSHPDLQTAIERNLQTANTYLGHFLSATFYHELHELDARWFTTPFSFNMVVSVSLAADTPESKIDEILKHITSSGAPLSWQIGASLWNARLENLLQANGWVKEGEEPAMCLDLHSLNVPVESPEGLTIEVVDDEETFKQYMYATALGFEFPEEMVNYMTTTDFGRRFLNDPVFTCYLARFDGKPVATAVLLEGEGIAGIYNIATIPQMRRRGFGRAVTLAPLLKARDLGYHIAALEASSMGQKLYPQLGFQTYSNFNVYRFPGNAEE